MSDWNRYGRQNDERRYGSDEGERRNVGRDDPYGQYGDWRDREERSFGRGGRVWPGGEAQSGYGGGRFTGQDYRSGAMDDQQRYGARQGQGYSDAWNRSLTEPDYGRRDAERRDADRRDMERRGGEWRAERQAYGQGGRGGIVGGNPELERVANGDEDRHFFGYEGQHRGRGPKNYTRSDDRIREDVNDRLSDDSWLDASQIEVQVKDGEVTLSGTVEGRQDKRRAEDVADRVSGVKHVQNNLRVQPSDDEHTRTR